MAHQPAYAHPGVIGFLSVNALGAFAAVSDATRQAVTPGAMIAALRREHMQMKTELYGGLVETGLSPDGPVRNVQTLDARYLEWARFRIPDGRDIKRAFDYWVKWDTLHVVWSEGDDVERIDPFERPGENSDLYKYPDSTAVGSTVEAIDPDHEISVTWSKLALL